jgi:hypothetical protein
MFQRREMEAQKNERHKERKEEKERTQDCASFRVFGWLLVADFAVKIILPSGEGSIRHDPSPNHLYYQYL